ncbi:LLM class flavin-dependent oxidoreductase [Bradyrhizobium sp. 153]|nr:LLM class flavin-dependent oxidoreductase [Bradyrhizobium sp. 153]
MASLEQLSNGRAAGNIVTSGYKTKATNFGEAELPGHDLRYVRAEILSKVANVCWDCREIRGQMRRCVRLTTKEGFSVSGQLNIA